MHVVATVSTVAFSFILLLEFLGFRGIIGRIVKEYA